MKGTKEEERTLSAKRFCILINDLCDFSEGHDETGYVVCKFDNGQMYLLEPKYCTECPNQFLMNDRGKKAYEARKSS